jgi:hypothetical protein
MHLPLLRVSGPGSLPLTPINTSCQLESLLTCQLQTLVSCPWVNLGALHWMALAGNVDGCQVAQSDPWFRTESPERAIHLCETAYYPHRLRLLGPSSGFGLTQRATNVGPITVGDITYRTDVGISFDETRTSYHVCVPLGPRPLRRRA